MNYRKLPVILALFLLLGLTGAVSAADLIVSGSILPAAPIIDFTGTPTSGARPLTIAFAATNTGGAVDTWDWDFGDGTTHGAVQNPSHQYTAAGTYTVKLTATNTGGNDVEEKTGYITVTTSINLGFTGTNGAATVNTVPASAIFARETNTVQVKTIKNTGTEAATNIVVALYASDVSSTVPVGTATIASLAAGATASTVTIVDPTSRNLAGSSVTYTAILDPDNLIAETNETDNTRTSVAKPLVYNGYKGKRFWDYGNDGLADDITTTHTYDLNGNIVYYSQPDSQYKGVGWTTRTETWTAANLPVPAGATVEKVLLFFSYNWDQTAGGYPNLVTTFNGNTISLGTPYRDWSNFGAYADYEYGLYPTYDVTNLFVKNGDNTLVTNPGNGGADNQVALYPSTLVVIYRDSSDTRKQIFINEEYDYLGVSQASYGTTLAEATAYAPFTGMTIDTGSVQSASWYSFATNAGPAEGNVFFNGNSLGTNVFTGSTMTADAKAFNVKPYLTATGNEAGVQGTESGGMGAIQQILVVEYTAAVPVAAFTYTPTQVIRGSPVSFDASTSTGSIASYTWDFAGTAGSGVTATHTFDTTGDKIVRLAVTGPGGSNYLEQTITVKEPAPVVDFSGTPTSGTSPLAVTFTATNTGGAATSYDWTFGDGQTQTTTVPTISHTYSSTTAQTYTVSLIAHGPDYNSATVTKPNYVSVGAQTIDVSVTSPSIAFGTMANGETKSGSTGVAVDVTGGTAWSVTAKDSKTTNKGFMVSGTTPLANIFKLSNGGSPHEMSTDFTDFLTGAAGVDGSGTASMQQLIGADTPGDYSITLMFEGGFV